MSFHIREIKREAKKNPDRWKTVIAIGMFAAKPLFGLYQSIKQRREKEERVHHRVVILKRIVLVLVALLISVFVIGALAKAIFSVEFSLRDIVSVAGSEVQTDENGYTNFLLAGSGDESHDGADLLDTIMIASIDPVDTNSVSIMSLPRDLYVLSTDKMGDGRINSLYRDYRNYLIREEGMEEKAASQASLIELKDEIGRKLGLDIQYVVRVNFTAFEQAVDAIGGIEIDVPYDIVDTEYPGPNYTYETFSLKAGPQILDGETALKYARSRHSTSDFSRSGRQQQLLIAGAEQAKRMELHKDIGKITELVGILSRNTEMNISIGEMITLADMADKLDKSRVITMQLNDSNGLYGSLIEPGGFLYVPPRDEFGGAFVLLPVSIPEFPVTWKQLKTLSKVFFHRRDIALENAPLAVLNGGGAPGSAAKIGGELYRYGLNVVDIANYPTQEDFTETFISARSTTGATAMWLSETLGVDIVPWSSQTSFDENPDVALVLGEDFSYKPLQDLLQ